MLGPLLGQHHIHYQLQKRTLRSIYAMQQNCNVLVSTCLQNAINNANSPLGRNIAYFRNGYGVSFNKIDTCKMLRFIQPTKLCSQRQLTINNLKHLLLVKYGTHVINGFTMQNIDAMINLLTTE